MKFNSFSLRDHEKVQWIFSDDSILEEGRILTILINFFRTFCGPFWWLGPKLDKLAYRIAKLALFKT